MCSNRYPFCTIFFSNFFFVCDINIEEQWEKDLEAELKDYEVVDNGAKDGGGLSSSTTQDNDDELPTISNLRTRSNNDWEEYADLIEDTDDLK